MKKYNYFAAMVFLVVKLVLIYGCSDSKSDSPPSLFSQELYNYGFVRFENDEVVCYKYGQGEGASISCHWK